MKHLTTADLYVLVKLVNQQRDVVAAVEDTAQMTRRQDLEFKGLPAESLFEQDRNTADVRELRRRLEVIRARLVKEIMG